MAAENEQILKFNFPYSRESYEEFTDREEMKEKMRQDFIRFEYRDDHGFIFYNFTFGVKTDQRMYAKCKICSSYLSWARNGNDSFILKNWSNYH